MAKEQRYTVQRVSDGTCRTIKGYSIRGAMAAFFAYFRGAECGERFRIKVYLDPAGWDSTFQWNGNNFRKVSND